MALERYSTPLMEPLPKLKPSKAGCDLRFEMVSQGTPIISCYICLLRISTPSMSELTSSSWTLQLMMRHFSQLQKDAMSPNSLFPSK
jgi:hypothetical protein